MRSDESYVDEFIIFVNITKKSSRKSSNSVKLCIDIEETARVVRRISIVIENENALV